LSAGYEFLAIDQFSRYQFGEPMIAQPSGDLDGSQEVAVDHPDMAVVSIARNLGLFGRGLFCALQIAFGLCLFRTVEQLSILGPHLLALREKP
jgi:hypothetical protein